MPGMSELMLIRPVTYLIFFLIFGTSFTGLAQEEDLAALYQEQNWAAIEELLAEGLIVSEDWKAFFAAATEPDANLAVQQMFIVYKGSSDTALRDIIRNRISQFYSAQGYYETARRITEERAFFESLASLKTDQSGGNRAETSPGVQARTAASFGVQIGAFRQKNGAERAQKKYHDKFPNVEILAKQRGNEQFFVVVIGPYQHREGAESTKKELKSKYHIEGYIIQY